MTTASPEPASWEEAGGSRVDAVADGFVEDYVRLDPLAATYFGVSGYDDQMTDLSPAGFEARYELMGNALTAMQGTERRRQRT